MQRLPKRLVPGSRLTTSAATYYTTPDNTVATISAMTVTNTTSAAVTVTIHLVPNASSAGNANVVLFEKVIPPGQSRIVGEAIGQSLAMGGTIQAQASAATSITLVASGYETTP